MKKTSFLLGIGIILLLIYTVSASYWIYSNLVTVTVGTTLSLTYTQIAQGTIDFTATLTPAITGAQIIFYETDSQGNNPISIGSANTNSNGIATLQLSGIANGVHYYKAGYLVP